MQRSWPPPSRVADCPCLVQRRFGDVASLFLAGLLPEAELLEMIERADTDQDGEINAEEFYTIMTKKTFS